MICVVLGYRHTPIKPVGRDRSWVARESPTRYRDHDIEMQCVWPLTASFQMPSTLGKSCKRTLALRSRQHLTYSITIIHRHIPQGVRGPHKLEPTSPQLHSDFTPGWCRSFGQVSLVSRADSHLHSARQSSIIFMLLNQSSCRWVAKMTWSFKFFMLGS